jgi:hypothetical protein
MLTKLSFTIVKSMSGAAAKAFADSPVPWPISSFPGFVVPGPSSTGAER